MLPTVLTEKSCVKWSGCCRSVFAKARPDLRCGPGEVGPKLTDGPSRGSVAAVFVPNTTRARCPSSETDHLAPTSSGRRPREKRRANIGRGRRRRRRALELQMRATSLTPPTPDARPPARRPWRNVTDRPLRFPAAFPVCVTLAPAATGFLLCQIPRVRR